MAIDFEGLAPEEGSGLSPRRNSRTSGPNPFLDNGWLEKSYDEGQDYQFGPVSGAYEAGVVKRGPRAGEPIDRLIGDAAQVVSMLRTAANKLNIGVAIEVVPGKRKGTMIVKYLGKERKNYSRDIEDAEDD